MKPMSPVSPPELITVEQPVSKAITITETTADLNWNNFYCLSNIVKNYRSH